MFLSYWLFKFTLFTIFEIQGVHKFTFKSLEMFHSHIRIFLRYGKFYFEHKFRIYSIDKICLHVYPFLSALRQCFLILVTITRFNTSIRTPYLNRILLKVLGN